jgi:Mn2+/Fe2+ NRAMP family transporter
MQVDQEKLAADLHSIQDAKQRGPVATLRAYMKLSGPGWLQSAITLGGGSLAGSLYLGVLAGYSMLCPFGAINRHISPVLGWSWAIATLMANMVWALPQYSLATGVVQQNLAPELLGDESGKYVIVALILAVTVLVTWSYGSGSRGARLYERMLKIVVALIVLCFVGVVIRLATAEERLPFGEILAGFIPDFSAFNRPAAAFDAVLTEIQGTLRTVTPVAVAEDFWTSVIVGQQRDVMIGAAATAVGINMTFLLPYTLLARGWGKEFRGLARFDLSTGMLIPFLLATSCVVIASASQFRQARRRDGGEDECRTGPRGPFPGREAVVRDACQA